jgi:Phosphoenolpyruvate synthase/pyruvate phosphate dikinase
VVGCGNATQLLKDGQGVTVSCAEGDTGFIFEGELGFDIKKNSVDAMPDLPFKIMMNVGNPDRAFDFAQLPNAGVGLARLEFIINRMIGVHPKALLNYDGLPQEIKDSVDKRIAGYSDPVGFYVEKLVEGISTLAGAFTPKKVIVRLSDFKSNEYANLIGGKLYEPEEKTRCWASAVLRVTSAKTSVTASNSSAVRSSVYATRWALPTSKSWCRSCVPWAKRAR